MESNYLLRDHIHIYHKIIHIICMIDSYRYINALYIIYTLYIVIEIFVQDFLSNKYIQCTHSTLFFRCGDGDRIERLGAYMYTGMYTSYKLSILDNGLIEEMVHLSKNNLSCGHFLMYTCLLNSCVALRNYANSLKHRI